MLRITKLTDYAIVVLAHLSRHAHVCVHPTSDIADATGVPQPTVAKVLKLLAQADLVHATRGAHGGYGLARDPAAVSVAEVIEAIEGPVGLTACSTDAGQGCSDEHHCHLSSHWPRINGAVRDALEQITLLQLARPLPHAQPGPQAAALSGK